MVAVHRGQLPGEGGPVVWGYRKGRDIEDVYIAVIHPSLHKAVLRSF